MRHPQRHSKWIEQRNMRTLLLGIDSGTQSTKVLVVNADSGKAFAQLLEGSAVKRNVVY